MVHINGELHEPTIPDTEIEKMMTDLPRNEIIKRVASVLNFLSIRINKLSEFNRITNNIHIIGNSVELVVNVRFVLNTVVKDIYTLK